MFPVRPSSFVLCLVTDRLALAADLAEPLDPVGALKRQVAAAVDAGIDLVHVRERDLPAGALAELVGECVVLAARSSTTVVVNDRVDVALASSAGVHLRGDSIAPATVRRLVPPGFVVGRSVRGVDDVPAAAGADYLVFGTVFPTPSKPGAAAAGLEPLSAVSRCASVPVLGIGGVSAETLPRIAATGAAGVAAIRLFFDAARDPSGFRRRVAAWRRAFDMHRSIS